MKINAVSRAIVGTAPGIPAGQIAFSSNGNVIYEAGGSQNQTLVIDAQSLATIATIKALGPVDGVFVSGTTLLVSLNNPANLYYYATTSLKLTNTVPLPSGGSFVFGVSPAESRIYLAGTSCDCCNCSGTVSVADFSSGQILTSQSYDNVDECPALA